MHLHPPPPNIYTQSSEYENELITEAHGLISDLLLTKETLNNDTLTKLKKIRELLNPKMERVASSSRRMFVGELYCLMLTSVLPRGRCSILALWVIHC